MSRSVNQVHLLGNVGKDPEVRFAASGAIVASFSLATNERYKDTQGNWQDRAEWHSIVAYSKQAELVRDYVKKGTKLFIGGKLQTRSWDKDGVTHYRTEVVLHQLVFTGDGQERAQAQATPPEMRHAAEGPPPSRRTLTEELEGTVITDEDVPF